MPKTVTTPFKVDHKIFIIYVKKNSPKKYTFCSGCLSSKIWIFYTDTIIVILVERLMQIFVRFSNKIFHLHNIFQKFIESTIYSVEENVIIDTFSAFDKTGYYSKNNNTCPKKFYYVVFYSNLIFV